MELWFGWGTLNKISCQVYPRLSLYSWSSEIESSPKQAPTKSSRFVKISSASSVKWFSLREEEDSNRGEPGHFQVNTEFRSQNPIHLPTHYLWEFPMCWVFFALKDSFCHSALSSEILITARALRCPVSPPDSFVQLSWQRWVRLPNLWTLQLGMKLSVSTKDAPLWCYQALFKIQDSLRDSIALKINATQKSVNLC